MAKEREKRWHVTVWQIIREWCELRGEDPDEVIDYVRVRKGRAEAALKINPKGQAASEPTRSMTAHQTSQPGS